MLNKINNKGKIMLEAKSTIWASSLPLVGVDGVGIVAVLVVVIVDVVAFVNEFIFDCTTIWFWNKVGSLEILFKFDVELANLHPIRRTFSVFLKPCCSFFLFWFCCCCLFRLGLSIFGLLRVSVIFLFKWNLIKKESSFFSPELSEMSVKQFHKTLK